MAKSAEIERHKRLARWMDELRCQIERLPQLPGSGSISAATTPPPSKSDIPRRPVLRG